MWLQWCLQFSKSDITVVAGPSTQVTFTNCTLFTKCITNVEGITIDDAEDLDLVMPVYNLIVYSLNYSDMTDSLWFYFKDEVAYFNCDIENTNKFKSFTYKAKSWGDTAPKPNPNQANEILKKCNNCCAIKLSKYFLEITRNVTE